MADLSRLWLRAFVFEMDLPQIAVGQSAVVRFPQWPERTYSARVSFLYPHIEPRTRRGELRLEWENPRQEIRPEMWADVDLVLDAGERLAVPASALIDTGQRMVAFADRGDGHLEPREVQVGIIALAGLAAQTGTVMIICLDEAFHTWQRAGRMKTQHDLFEAITYGALQRVRPKLMTVAMMTLDLVPALCAEGAGAEAIQRIAAPMIGGMITSTILTLEIVPAIYSLWRGRQVEWVKGPPPPRKSWEELSQQFAEWEKSWHGTAPS